MYLNYSVYPVSDILESNSLVLFINLAKYHVHYLADQMDCGKLSEEKTFTLKTSICDQLYCNHLVPADMQTGEFANVQHLNLV